MRLNRFIFVLLAGASFTVASVVERWSSSTVDTTTQHINTGEGKVALGALSSGNNGVAVGALTSGSYGLAIKGMSTGANSVGIKGLGTNYGVMGEGIGSTGFGVYGYGPGATAAGVSGLGGYWGVHGQGGPIGVYGVGSSYGVQGTANTGYGVFGLSANGTGVRAQSQGSAYGLDASSLDGVGARMVSTNNTGAVVTGSTGMVVTGNYAGIEVSVSHLYASGLAVAAGGRGYGMYTYGGYRGVHGGAVSWDGYDNTQGVTGDAYGGDVAYGVVGYAGGGNYENWAGWFNGDVYVGGYFDNPSDQKFKTNVREYRGGLDKILALKIKSYDMKVDEFKDRIHLPSGPQIGVIAQEAEEVFPEIVHSATAPARVTPEEHKKGVKKEDVKFKSVNYNALIPVLVQAIQELQAEVEALKAGRK